MRWVAHASSSYVAISVESSRVFLPKKIINSRSINKWKIMGFFPVEFIGYTFIMSVSLAFVAEFRREKCLFRRTRGVQGACWFNTT